MTKNRRRRKFISSWAQFSIALEIVLHALLFISLLALILFAPPFVSMLSDYDVVNHQAIAKELFRMNLGKWPLFLGLAIFLGLVSILFSHHIVGPAYRFKHALQKLNDRDLDTRVTLRKWDYFDDLKDELNQHISQLRNDVSTLAKHAEKVETIVQEVKSRGLSDKTAELEKELQSIKKVLNTYQNVREDS